MFEKEGVYPLNFLEYLEIKFGVVLSNNLSDIFHDLLMSGNIDEVTEVEKEIQLKMLKEIPSNIDHEWENYIQYGNLPFGINDNPLEIVQETLDINDRIIEKDFLLISSLNEKTRKSAFPLIKQLAMQKPGTVNNSSLANMLNIDSKTVKKLLEVLENTELIYHIESYGSPSNRERKTYEYYFLATQIKAAYFLNYGDISNNYREYLGILLENLMATSLYKLQRSKGGFGVYYDSRSGGVDFIIKALNHKPVPVEVGIGKKNKRQITNAMKKYNSDYGIVISNKTDHITKEDNVIFIPVKTFSLI